MQDTTLQRIALIFFLISTGILWLYMYFYQVPLVSMTQAQYLDKARFEAQIVSIDNNSLTFATQCTEKYWFFGPIDQLEQGMQVQVTITTQNDFPLVEKIERIT